MISDVVNTVFPRAQLCRTKATAMVEETDYSGLFCNFQVINIDFGIVVCLLEMVAKVV